MSALGLLRAARDTQLQYAAAKTNHWAFLRLAHCLPRIDREVPASGFALLDRLDEVDHFIDNCGSELAADITGKTRWEGLSQSPASSVVPIWPKRV